MFIRNIISQHRNDFSAIMECEHCGGTEINRYGYDDVNYHENVIPAMFCKSCGKNREGTEEENAKRLAILEKFNPLVEVE